MITSNANPETVQESITNGASGFVVKPFNSASVLNALNKVAGRLRREND